MLYSSYTPWVAKMLGSGYQVQHAPWDQEDGGVLNSKYGLRCLRLFLQTAMLEPTRYDGTGMLSSTPKPSRMGTGCSTVPRVTSVIRTVQFVRVFVES